MPLPRERAAVTAERVAGQCVDFVREKFGFSLPFTPESLLLVDAIVDKIKGTRATESQASTLLHGLGCYAGEVFVRHARGSWRAAAEMTVEDGPSTSAMVVALPGLVRCDVIGAVFERFRLGDKVSVASLYEHHTAADVDLGASDRARPWDAGVPRSDKGR